MLAICSSAPDVPRIEQAYSKNSDSITVEFTEVSEADSYILRAESKTGDFFYETNVTSSPGTMVHLQPYTDYIMSVLSLNSSLPGRSQPSYPVEARTGTAKYTSQCGPRSHTSSKMYSNHQDQQYSFMHFHLSRHYTLVGVYSRWSPVYEEWNAACLLFLNNNRLLSHSAGHNGLSFHCPLSLIVYSSQPMHEGWNFIHPSALYYFPNTKTETMRTRLSPLPKDNQVLCDQKKIVSISHLIQYFILLFFFNLHSFLSTWSSV